MPLALGSQATALTSATSSGGKTARPPRPRSILEPLDAFVAEASSPIPDPVGRHIDALGDLAVGVALGGQQHELGAHDNPVGQRQAGRPLRELAANLSLELDRCCRSSHAVAFVNWLLAPSTRWNFRRGVLSRPSRGQSRSAKPIESPPSALAL